MPAITFDRFDFGLDLRKGPSTSDANRLRVLTNAYATTGRTIKKRPGTVKIADLEAGTVGLSAGKGKLNTFYAGASTITHADTTFEANKLLHPTTPALELSRMWYSDVFNGYLYVSAEYTDGSIKHHYLEDTLRGVTITIASPAVFTQVGHGYVAGDAITFGTTGALPTGLTVAATYYVIAAGLTADTYQVSATIGGAAVNTSGTQSGIQVVARRTWISDVNCPNTKAVIKKAQSIWAIGTTGDTVRFTATSNPRDWTTASDAGFLPVGLQQSGATVAKGLGEYNSQLLVLFPDSAQVWTVDTAPTNNALAQIVDVGSKHPYSHANMSGDVFFLSPQGVRSITNLENTSNLIDVDVGSPVDSLITSIFGSNSPRALYYRGGGQFWMYYGTKALVYTFSRSGKISAWSIYEFPYSLDYLTELDATLYIRSGNDVYRMDDTAFDDDGVTFTVTAELAFVDFKMPGVLKQVWGMDLVLTGTGTIAHRYDVRSPDLITTPPVELTGDSRPGRILPVELLATNLAPVIVNHDAADFELHAITYYFENLGVQV